jgi:transposase
VARRDLSGFEWSIIEPLQPNRPCGGSTVDDRRMLSGAARLAVSHRLAVGGHRPALGAARRRLRPVRAPARGRRLGSAVVRDDLGRQWRDGHDRQSVGAGRSARRRLKKWAKKGEEDGARGRSTGGFAVKIPALVDAEGRPDQRLQARHRPAGRPRNRRHPARRQGQAWADVPPRKNRKGLFVLAKWLHRQRDLIERLLHKPKNHRGVAARHDRNPKELLAAVKIIGLGFPSKFMSLRPGTIASAAPLWRPPESHHIGGLGAAAGRGVDEDAADMPDAVRGQRRGAHWSAMLHLQGADDEGAALS